MLTSATESLDTLRAGVKNVRYGPVIGNDGHIDFDFNGHTYRFVEPMDIVISGTNSEAERRYCVKMLLSEQCEVVDD